MKDYSDGATKSRGGDLGLVAKGELTAEIDKAVFSLPVGSVSDPIGTKFGWHLVKVIDKIPVSYKPFADVKAELLKREQDTQFQKKLAEYLDKLKRDAVIRVSTEAKTYYTPPPPPPGMSPSAGPSAVDQAAGVLGIGTGPVTKASRGPVFEIAPTVGWRFGGTTSSTGNTYIENIKIPDSLSFGLTAEYVLKPWGSLELLWSHQDTELRANLTALGAGLGQDERLSHLNIDTFQLGGLWQSGDPLNRARLYLDLLFGVTIFTPAPEFSTLTRLLGERRRRDQVLPHRPPRSAPRAALDAGVHQLHEQRLFDVQPVLRLLHVLRHELSVAGRRCRSAPREVLSARRTGAVAAAAQPAISSARQRDRPPSSTRRSAVRRPFARRARAAAVRTAREARMPGSSPSVAAFASRDFLSVSTSRSSAGSTSIRSPRRAFGQSAGARAAARARASPTAVAKEPGSERGPGNSFSEISFAGGGRFCREKQALVREDAERGKVEGAGAGLARLPEGTRERAFPVREGVRPLDPPVVLRVGFAPGGKNRRGQSGALLGVPREAALRLEVARERLHERGKVEDVRGGVGDHRRRERPRAPVGTLVRLVERDAGARGEERGQADLLLAEKLRREHRVEEGCRAKAVSPREEPEVVVGAVHEEPPRSEAREERGRHRAAREGPRGRPCRPRRAAGGRLSRSSGGTSPPRCRARRRPRAADRGRRGGAERESGSSTNRAIDGAGVEAVTSREGTPRRRRTRNIPPRRDFP